ncbi:UNVERIFIED_CONTAM: hypothetical protein Slati_0119800 [Sesamum latifolium]|uniref:Reverse transcriptase domain-containing protein n=1 Tax=Sesamum latifolium TaxID=2727402 RepID=A0AAW2YA46_9LAMI
MSSRIGELTFDLETKKTARKLRWETKQHTEEASTSYEDGKDITLEFEESLGESEEEVMAIIPERSIKDMTSPDLNQQELCIEYPDLEVNFELKTPSLIHLLPTFRGLAREDPHKHLKEFHVVCSGMRPEGITEEKQYFYEGLSGMDRKLIDAANGGALFNKTPSEAHNLISIMASNTQQFGTRYDDPPRRSNEVKPPIEHAEAIGEFFGQPQRRYDPFSNTYNPRWKDHPNMSYGAQSQNFQRPQYRPPVQPPPPNPKPSPSLEDMMKAFVANTQQF